MSERPQKPATFIQFLDPGGASFPQQPAFNWQPYQGRPEPTYAGFWRRFIANCIDNGIVTIMLKVLNGVLLTARNRLLPVSSPWQVNVGLATLIALAFILVDWLYFAGFESSAWQGTPG